MHDVRYKNNRSKRVEIFDDDGKQTLKALPRKMFRYFQLKKLDGKQYEKLKRCVYKGRGTNEN